LSKQTKFALQQVYLKNNSLDISASYDHFILDIWGVIHDGTSTYEGVVENITKLKQEGKRIYFLSNAPRRAAKVIVTLEKFGITDKIYDFVMTSGEATYLSLKQDQENGFKNYGQNYYYIGPDKDKDLLDGLKYNEVKEIDSANFAIVTGFDHDLSTKDEKIEDLKNCLKHNLTLICVNPDLIVVKQTGQEMLCGGLIAQQYEEMGGNVIYFGKPYKEVYDTIFSLANISDQDRIVAIGDSIITDIKGANNNNIDSALIGGGILSADLKIKHGELPQREDLTKLCEDYQIYPKFVLAQL
jgi:HAD superfamily hydrolase (TIGR01459 family)